MVGWFPPSFFIYWFLPLKFESIFEGQMQKKIKINLDISIILFYFEPSLNNKTMTKQKVEVLSPDGFTIEFDMPYYNSMEEAMEKLASWQERYKKQGYYSSAQHGRIPYNLIPEFCWVNIIE
jgi:hypothetical protein